MINWTAIAVIAIFVLIAVGTWFTMKRNGK